MKAKISTFKTLLREEMKRRLQKEDTDRLRRAADGYGETEFEEDVDRLRRAADGYGETDFEEALSEEPAPPPPSSAFGRAGEKFTQQGQSSTVNMKGQEMARTLMSMVGNDPQAYAAFAKAMRTQYGDHPLSKKLPPTLSPSAPDPSGQRAEGSDEEAEKKKSKKGKSHAKPSEVDSDSGEAVAGEAHDTVSGRDPNETEPFDKALKLPIHNMSDPDDDTADIPLLGVPDEEMEESFFPKLSCLTKKK